MHLEVEGIPIPHVESASAVGLLPLLSPDSAVGLLPLLSPGLL